MAIIVLTILKCHFLDSIIEES